MKIKIVEGQRNIFEEEVNRLMKEGWEVSPETHRIMEFYGKIMYSVVLVKGGDKNG